tara:strand:- start:646 stop:909 length:264 start_codon:yes stop_codon:yes gene_type:complete
MQDNIDLICNKEVTNYFRCIEKYKDLTIETKECQSLINDYFSCLDSKRFKEGYLKKLRKEKEYQQEKNTFNTLANWDYLDHSVLSGL